MSNRPDAMLRNITMLKKRRRAHSKNSFKVIIARIIRFKKSTKREVELAKELLSVIDLDKSDWSSEEKERFSILSATITKIDSKYRRTHFYEFLNC